MLKMDSFHLFLTTSTTAVAIFVIPLFILSLLFLWTSRNSFKSRAPPEAGSSWPIIGHLHLFRGPQPPHLVLSDMADKYGAIFTIKMGVHKNLVVSDSETVKQCFTTNDKAFASRPKTLAMELLSYNQAMFAGSPYGPYWREIRKIATLELLSNHRIDSLKHIRQSEVKAFMQELYLLWKESPKDGSDKVLVEMKKWFMDVTVNMILKMVVGKRISRNDAESDRWKEALEQFFMLMGKFVVSDALPYLRLLDIGGDEKLMKEVREKLDVVVEGWLQDHKRRRASEKCTNEEDFMDVMLSILTDTNEHDADTINKATCLNMILAASDSTMVTLTWALSLLLNNREALKKVQEELDIHVGRNKLVEESDVKHLVYLQAIIKETLRLYPAGPLSVLHESVEDCTVNGYHIPAGTRLITNIYKLHRDPRVWSDPYRFQPERFLTSHKDVELKGKNFELIPFGSGRRMCPGISFAIKVLEFTIANVLQGFELGTPLNEAVDMSETLGMTNLKATPLHVLITPRLPVFCYF